MELHPPSIRWALGSSQQPQEQRAAGAGAVGVGAASLSVCISEGIANRAGGARFHEIYNENFCVLRVIYPNLEENRGESGKKAPSGHKARRNAKCAQAEL